MDAYFRYKQRGTPELTNMPMACIACIRTSGEKATTVKCESTGKKRRHIHLVTDDDELYFCSGEDLKSTRRFHERLNAFKQSISTAANHLHEKAERIRGESRRRFHNLVKLNAQSIQSIHAAVPPDTFAQASRTELLSAVEKVVTNNPAHVAKLIVDLLKNENLKKAEFAVYNKLFEMDEPSLHNYSVHKVVLLVLNSFWDEFRDKDVTVSLGSCYEKVKIDFDAVAAVLTHVFHNTVKYTLPGTSLKIRFEVQEQYLTIKMEMVSLKVNDDEASKIFEEGYSGAAPKMIKKDGEGLGLWIAKQLLQTMGADARIKPNVDSASTISKFGVEYVRNDLEIDLVRSN